MSWGVSVSQKPKEEIVDALDEGFANNHVEPHDAVLAQFNAARDAVSELLAVVEGDVFNCALSGHSQAAAPASASDSLSISLYAAVPSP